MWTSTVRELGLMGHLIVGSESYETCNGLTDKMWTPFTLQFNPMRFLEITQNPYTVLT
jgi:hypothetical protein